MELIVSSGCRCIDVICRLVFWVVRNIDIRTVTGKKIVTIICFIVCKIRKEILIKESLSIIGLELGFFIVISYILFVAGFPIE